MSPLVTFTVTETSVVDLVNVEGSTDEMIRDHHSHICLSHRHLFHNTELIMEDPEITRQAPFSRSSQTGVKRKDCISSYGSFTKNN